MATPHHFFALFFLPSLLLGFSPRISIITSIYKGDEFIKGFMEDVTRQTIFDQCELILINANSPGNEEEVILPYIKKYPNIVYQRLDEDPGLYGVWNLGIGMAKAPYITNANLDDRLRPDCYEVHADALDNHPKIELVYSACYITKTPNDIFDDDVGLLVLGSSNVDFSPQNMVYCLPNNHPMWRKRMHDKYGLFDEHYKAAGDWEMWLRAVKGGAHFLRVPGVYGLYYENPQGLSGGPNDSLARQEALEVGKRYRIVFDPQWAKKHGFKKLKKKKR